MKRRPVHSSSDSKPPVVQKAPEKQEQRAVNKRGFGLLLDRLPSRRKVRNWSILLASILVLGIGGYKGYNYHLENKAAQAKEKAEKKAAQAKAKAIKVAKRKRNARIDQFVARLNKCKAGDVLKRLCMNTVKYNLLMKSAMGYERSKNYFEAGMMYAKIGQDFRAFKMAERIKVKNEKGAQKIRDEIKLMADAIRRYSNL
jgi:hypothetical protein